MILIKKTDLIRKLASLDHLGVYVFVRSDIEKMFPNEAPKALEKSLQRMVRDGFLVRAARGVYVNPSAHCNSGRIIEDVAKALRPGAFSYVSLESILSEYGVISQIPINRITVMTTGAPGTCKTPFGTVEFTHTKRSPANVLRRSMQAEGRPLRIATKKAAIADLRRVGRNVNMMNLSDQGGEDDEGEDYEDENSSATKNTSKTKKIAQARP